MTSKLKSRRFIALMLWTVLMFVSVAITKAVDPTLAGWYGVITSFYIGSSVAKSYIYKDKGDE